MSRGKIYFEADFVLCIFNKPLIIPIKGDTFTLRSTHLRFILFYVINESKTWKKGFTTNNLWLKHKKIPFAFNKNLKSDNFKESTHESNLVSHLAKF